MGLLDHMAELKVYNHNLLYVIQIKSYLFIYYFFCCASDNRVKVVLSRLKTNISHLQLRLVLGKIAFTIVFI